jgi:2-desacetyl-2-hydroxyethyl bacteriochlorophyllide A dehydrogenase
MPATAEQSNPTVVIVGPGSVEVQDRPLRPPGPGEVLVKTLYSGISAGTEMNVYRGAAPQWRMRHDPLTGLFASSSNPEWTYPLVYGYAAAGRIEQTGDDVTGVNTGDYVFTYTPHQSYSTVAADAAVALPQLRDLRHGVFFANLNTALNGILDAGLHLGDVVVVMGLGVIGQLVAQLARRSGVGVIVTVDALQHRRELSLRLGADHSFEPGPDVAEAVRELSSNRGADVVFDVSGAPTALHEAIRTAGLDALVIAMSWYGNTFEALSLSGEFHHNRVRIHSSFVGYVNPALGPLWSTERRSALVLDLLNEIELDPLLSHTFPVSNAAEAYRVVDAQPEGLVQCLLEYPT